ncbi:MAG: hypothetical protein HQL48_09695 [Gammaproteobacteria bacterium]|nr:hypothetical protein [Gammaproteobacteria bacterium]
MKNSLKWVQQLVAATLLFSLGTVANGEEYKPFVLAYTTDGAVPEVSSEVTAKLQAAGFELVGHYNLNPETTIYVITSGALKKHAAASKFGGYGAIQRVAVTRVGEETQVTYTNPTYMAHAYQMEGDLADVTTALEKALGRDREYGVDKALSGDDLRGYHYMFGMEYFDDYSDHLLAEHPSQEEALKVVEANLAAALSGVTKVYRVDIPGKEETVIGVALKGEGEKEKAMDDGFIMGEIDFKSVRSSAHLPVEMLISEGKVYALYYRFRIAVNFPELSMMGSNSFMNIMDSPDAAKAALKKVATAQ